MISFLVILNKKSRFFTFAMTMHKLVWCLFHLSLKSINIERWTNLFLWVFHEIWILMKRNASSILCGKWKKNNYFRMAALKTHLKVFQTLWSFFFSFIFWFSTSKTLLPYSKLLLRLINKSGYIWMKITFNFSTHSKALCHHHFLLDLFNSKVICSDKLNRLIAMWSEQGNKFV